MPNTPEVKNPETFLKDSRFSQTFRLPADPSGDHGSLQVKYADYGYHNPTNPEDEHVLLFFAPLCASRIFHCAKDDLAKKYRVRIIIMDRPGFGGTDAVKLEKRAVLCRKMTLALLRHLGINHVSVACHSGGTIYALDMLLHHPEILHPERSYIAIGAPWILPSRSHLWSTSLIQALPDTIMAQADKVIGFVNGTLGPVFAPSAGISQIFRSSARSGPGETVESNADAALEESLESHFFGFVHSESIKGFSDELQFLMQKVEGVSGWGDWLDYDDLMPKLVEALKGAGRQLTVEVFYAEQDSLIGAPGGQGPQWLNGCWEGDIAKEVVTYKTNTVKGTDHDTIWSIRQGVPEEVLKKVGS
ncbi:hypothetical protein DER45DRAFT_575881 [Fusarium avenaceum]|nr:hypothetical protein DER45DRAFT_575881 [Fusarium avenaceum]